MSNSQTTLNDSSLTATETLRVEAPKALGDVVEALIGALYIDSGSSLDSVRPFVQRYIIEPYLVDVLAEAVDNPWGSHREPSAIYEEMCNIVKCSHLKEEYTAPLTGPNGTTTTNTNNTNTTSTTTANTTSTYEIQIKLHSIPLPYTGRGSNKKAAKANLTKQLMSQGPMYLLNTMRDMCSCRVGKNKANSTADTSF